MARKHSPRPPRSTFALDDFLDAQLLKTAKIIGQRTQTSTAEVINAALRYTFTQASALNALFPFAAAMVPPQLQVPQPPPEAPAPPPADDETNETAEERLAKLRDVAAGKEALPETERETPASGVEVPS